MSAAVMVAIMRAMLLRESMYSPLIFTLCPEVIAKPLNISHAKFAKYVKFCFMDDFANLADFA